MSQTFDVIVLGLGAAGSSALYHLSKTGKKVCGIDQFSPPHTFGSSHGQSRIIRQAYHENPKYVPLVKQAYDYWAELEKESGRQLFKQTGGIMLGHRDAGVVKGAELSAQTHNIPYEYLDSHTINQRYPAFKPGEATVGILEKTAGILFPEDCIEANLNLAAKNQAEIRLNEKVISINPHEHSVEIVTAKGRYTTDKLVVSAGAWLTELLPEPHLPLTVERQVLYWFKNSDSSPSRPVLNELPVYIWEYTPGKIFYGFPDLGDGIKVAHHHAGEPTTPHTLTKQVREDEVQAMSEVIGRYFNINPVFNYATTCMYTNTPDENFIIDHHPNYKHIIVASPCSGHGFKFASVTGKILSDMALDKKPEADISMFSIHRF
ncbi:N-methyl-L-tryptophan oxidase [Mucilaginibacter gynuensis]|uniref:N-methyl-L-tryptophan oxidase n=1 Tax=Mucilaginibacter gynuensis TaxID=1302236 RepID=A0ABP8FSM9_9SPHI